MGKAYKCVATWKKEAGHREKFLSRRGMKAQEQVAQTSGGNSVFRGFYSLDIQTHS